MSSPKEVPGQMSVDGVPPREGTRVFSERAPWQMSYAELCSQPIVLYRAKKTKERAVNGLNWTQMLNATVAYADFNRENIFKTEIDRSTLRNLIAHDSLEGYFHLSQPPENIERVTEEEREANFERVVYYNEKAISDEYLNPLTHKKLDDGKRVVYRPLALWTGGVELAIRAGEHVSMDIFDEYRRVKDMYYVEFEQYEAEHNQFATQ